MCTIVILLTLVSMLLVLSPAVANDIQNIDNNLLHLGWVWPDSLPELWTGCISDDDDRIYVLDKEGNLYCLDISGEIIWKYKGEYESVETGITLTQNSLIFLARSGSKRDINKEIHFIGFDGKFIKKISIPASAIGTPAITDNGEIYVEAQSKYSRDKYYYINIQGDINCYNYPNNHPGDVIGFDSSGNYYFYEYYGDILMHSKPNGELIKTFSQEDKLRGDNTIDKDGNLYCVSGGNTVLCLDSNFNTIWKQKLWEENISQGITVIETNNSNVFVGTNRGSIYSLNAQDGNLNWKYKNEIEQRISIIQPDNKGGIVCIDNISTISKFNKNGDKLWSSQMYEPGIAYKPLLTKTEDFFIFQSGKLYKFTNDKDCVIKSQEYAPLPANKNEATQEIASFILEYILEDEITSLTEFIETMDQDDDKPLLIPPHEALIIYCPIKSIDKNRETIKYSTDSDNPIRTWINIGTMLHEKENQKSSIDEYMNRNDTNSMVPWRYSRYEFGIISIRDDLKQAEIQLDYHCGMLCGNGSHYVIARSPSGKWWIVDSKGGWIS